MNTKYYFYILKGKYDIKGKLVGISSYINKNLITVDNLFEHLDSTFKSAYYIYKYILLCSTCFNNIVNEHKKVINKFKSGGIYIDYYKLCDHCNNKFKCLEKSLIF